MLAEKYSSEIESILAKYPDDRKRSAVLPLMYLAQCEYGSVTLEAMIEIADLLDIDVTQVASLIGFYTLLWDRPGGKYRIQICTDLPCALQGAEEFAHQLCEKLGIQLGGTTPDGMISVEGVMCLAACNGAPMFQVQGPDGIQYHERQTVESALALIDELRKRDDSG
ncbi:MAG TPA: NAD(P)H-dependent oxidoreductase subunit E [Anaerolineae bacterium]|nr:NAD(P)H-dependent oxidoreductase subunit E [Anaerolineae bacterium]